MGEGAYNRRRLRSGVGGRGVGGRGKPITEGS